MTRYFVVTLCCGRRVRDQFGNADIPVGNAVDERHVGAVFQQTAHQIGQQVFVRAYRRVDAAGNIETLHIGNGVVQFFAHAV